MNEQELIELMKGNILARRKFNKTLKEETASQLATRANTLRKYLIEMKPEPLESIKETIARKKPLHQLLEKINKAIREKDAKQKVSLVETEQEWVQTEIPKHFQPTTLFRYATGLETDALRTGQYKLHHVHWRPLTDFVITVKTQSGRIIRRDLQKIIAPHHWRYLLENPLHPLHFKIEKAIALRKGKPIDGYWDHSKDFATAQQTKPIIFPCYLAIMTV